MSTDFIDLAESYILAEDKEKFFSSLIKNSETYLSMRVLSELNKHGLDLPEVS